MSTMDEYELDLDAARREANAQPPRIKLGGETFTLPVQLPAAVLDPLFEHKLDDLITILVDLAAEGNPADPDSADLTDLFAKVRERPLILVNLLDAIHEVFRRLIGEEQWPRWRSKNPSIPDYIKVAKFAWSVYGVSLGEALGFGTSSSNGGGTSSRTSVRKALTRAGSGSRLRTQT
jgi:hypothetical protein